MSDEKLPNLRAKWTVFAVVGVLSLVADQLTKVLARAWLAGPGCTVPDDIVSAPARNAFSPLGPGTSRTALLVARLVLDAFLQASSCA